MHPHEEGKVEAKLVELIRKRKNLGKILLCFRIFPSISSYEAGKLLGIKYGEIHKEMNELEKFGLLKGREERVKGTLRIKKVYELTEKGKAILPLLEEEMMQSTIKFFRSIGLEGKLWQELRRSLIKAEDRKNEENSPED